MSWTTRGRTVRKCCRVVGSLRKVGRDRRLGRMDYRRCGNSGLVLPSVSLGFWHNFGDDKAADFHRRAVLRAFELGINHFDLANNYGPPVGAAEANLGRLLASDLSGRRDELTVSTKAGWKAWPGPYGQGGSSRKHLLASLDQSLARLQIDYVDVFYSHRFDAETPLEETAAALDTAVRSGRALYVGISSYGTHETREIAGMLRQLGTPLIVHQPAYSILNRWIEREGMLEASSEEGFGVVAFTALAQGLLTDRYKDGIPQDSRAASGKSLDPAVLSDDLASRLGRLEVVARGRGQSLAQLALVWALRDPRISSVVVGVSDVDQIEANVKSLNHPDLDQTEIDAIDSATEGFDETSVDLWIDARRGRVRP